MCCARFLLYMNQVDSSKTVLPILCGLSFHLTAFSQQVARLIPWHFGRSKLRVLAMPL